MWVRRPWAEIGLSDCFLPEVRIELASSQIVSVSLHNSTIYHQCCSGANHSWHRAGGGEHRGRSSVSRRPERETETDHVVLYPFHQTSAWLIWYLLWWRTLRGPGVLNTELVLHRWTSWSIRTHGALCCLCCSVFVVTLMWGYSGLYWMNPGAPRVSCDWISVWTAASSLRDVVWIFTQLHKRWFSRAPGAYKWLYSELVCCNEGSVEPSSLQTGSCTLLVWWQCFRLQLAPACREATVTSLTDC